ncbi:N-acetyl-1-D-myo-inositol-2-amino-2-deoxy-alpha-D-glucopyranoside deacetylase [Mycolicibacterium litorale]|uniref:1D-myo-inositol 2-acetamido-2-deoxy-alpha-D-glucopyranoside deacetylase n=1 Tax=Mycolicibacterium litorale TaxID=758802 RepID=A0AAD1IG53_9MYCO|nr:N-acetyl-1-D-myo-inositol-2-amino-2-deoxy-alpha-D-glucopyranoside deacetylase [Mycolicibacterium litorale]TDY05834.1 N-acetyl-1-D-myo-inositol-2-amino-2-deoxy-alpha-D-glucopyranoside deacetylase [Mycolicibacterium litorale]BBY14660.1 1D-myo-inositol 2-acetamido-2-deoxy-alpha-D-glucopyranoside deacetylase [Mycolicibacterium litorale]
MTAIAPRLLFVHAHPDDETLTTGGTIGHYARAGADVRVVTCTLGEEGEVIGERYAQLAVDHADQLGGYRISELTAALSALGVDEPRFLGGPGHWRDSGMEGTPERHHQRFVDADMSEAAGLLAAIIDDFRPHVVVTYDPAGGYGHPDHIQTHRVTTAAVERAQWRVPKLYWTVMSASAMQEALDAAEDVPEAWLRINANDVPFCLPDDKIDAGVDVSDSLQAKVAALRAHATQVSVAANGQSCALSNNIAMPIPAQEHYILAAGEAGARDERGWESDLLAGLDLA